MAGSTYLTRTISSTGDRKKWTWSGWLKRSGLSTNYIMSSNNGSNQYSMLQFDSADRLRWYDYTSDFQSHLKTNRKFKDISGWYHIVITYDTAQSSSSDRIKIYVNGQQETSLDTSTYPSQSYDSYMNFSGVPHYLGRETGTEYLYDGIMSHVHFCDGYAYSPSDFGETDSTTGEWKIKAAPSVSYGTNGYFMFKDNASVSDQSGQGNNFTLTAGTLTKTEDCPSNVFATGNPHYWTNSAWDAATLTNGNNVLGGSISTDTYAGIWSSLVMPRKGKYYTEFKITAGSSGGGNAYVGITTPESVNETSNAGKYSGYTNMGGNHGHEYSIYGSDGQKYVKENGGTQSGSTYGSNTTFGTNDIICIACDLDNNKLYFRKNGDAWLNSGNPESGSTGTGALSIINHDYHMFICDGGGGTFINAAANYGNGYFGTTAVSSAGTNASNNGIFEYDVPAGYTALCTKGINSF